MPHGSRRAIGRQGLGIAGRRRLTTCATCSSPFPRIHVRSAPIFHALALGEPVSIVVAGGKLDMGELALDRLFDDFDAPGEFESADEVPGGRTLQRGAGIEGAHENAIEIANSSFLSTLSDGVAAEFALIGWLLALPSEIDPALAAGQLRRSLRQRELPTDEMPERQHILAMLDDVAAWPAERLLRLDRRVRPSARPRA